MKKKIKNMIAELIIYWESLKFFSFIVRLLMVIWIIVVLTLKKIGWLPAFYERHYWIILELFEEMKSDRVEYMVGMTLYKELLLISFKKNIARTIIVIFLILLINWISGFWSNSGTKAMVFQLVHPNRKDRLTTVTMLEKDMLWLSSCGYTCVEINKLITKIIKYNKMSKNSWEWSPDIDCLEVTDREGDLLKLALGKTRNQEVFREIEKSGPIIENSFHSEPETKILNKTGKPLEQPSNVANGLIGPISQEGRVSQDMIEKNNEKLVEPEFIPGETHLVEMENFDTLELTFNRGEKAEFSSLRNRSKRKILGTPIKYLPNCGLFRIKAGEYNLLAARHKILLKGKSQSFTQAYTQDSKDGRSLYNVILEKKVKRLKSLSTRPSNSKLFWSVAWHEFMESKVYLVSCLLHVLPHWHRKMSIIDVLKIINETRELIKNKHAHIEIRRVYIPKPNGKVRPLGVPRMSHRIYLHMINNLLSIYISGQVLINPNQHGFQPGKGTLTAWKQIISEVIEAENIWEFDLVKFFDEIHVQAILDKLIEKDCPFFIQKLLGELCMSKPILPVRREDWKMDESPFLPIPTYLKLKKEDGSTVILENNKDLQLEMITAYRKKHKERLQDFDQPLTYSNEEVTMAKSVPQGGSLSPPLSTLGLENSLFGQIINKINEMEKVLVKIVMYADDGLIYWSNKKFEIERLMEELNSVLSEFGIQFSLEKSGWIKKDGVWLRPLKFVGLSYDALQSPPLLSASTRSGANLPVSQEMLEFVKQYELNKARDSHLSLKEKQYLTNPTQREYATDLQNLRNKMKEIVKIKKLIKMPGLYKRQTEYQTMAGSELFGFIQNRLYQNSVNLMPVKQNFSIFNELKGNSMIKEIMRSGSKLELMSMSKITALLTVFNASSVASDVLLRLLSETSLSNIGDYKKRAYWWDHFRFYLNRTVRWHDLCPRVKKDKFGVSHDVLQRQDYIAATRTRRETVKVLLKRAKLSLLRRDQLLARYSYFTSSTRRDIKISRSILKELNVRHRILGVINPAQYIKSEERSILMEMHIDTAFRYREKQWKKLLKEYRTISLQILNYNKKYKSWLFTLNVSFISYYGLEPLVRPISEEKRVEIYESIRGGLSLLSAPTEGFPLKEALWIKKKVGKQTWNGLELVGVTSKTHALREEIRGLLKEKSGIYLWTDLKEKKQYVGSSKDLYRRLLEYLNKNNLLNHLGMDICAVLSERGLADFEYTILEYCSPGERLDRENFYIDKYNPEYNTTRALTNEEYSVRKQEQIVLGDILARKQEIEKDLLNPKKVTTKRLSDLSPLKTKMPTSVELSADEIFLLKNKYPEVLAEVSSGLKIARARGVTWYRWWAELTDIEKIHEIIGCRHSAELTCFDCMEYIVRPPEVSAFGKSLIDSFGKDPEIYQNKQKLSDLIATSVLFKSMVEKKKQVEKELEKVDLLVKETLEKSKKKKGTEEPLVAEKPNKTILEVSPVNENKKYEKEEIKEVSPKVLSKNVKEKPKQKIEELEDFGDLFDHYDPKDRSNSEGAYVPTDEDLAGIPLEDEFWSDEER